MTEKTPDPSADAFDLETFLPFVLNQAAEALSRAFQPAYREAFGLTRTQWRVLAIAGRYDAITSRDICAIAHEEKSRVSRAVAALEAEGLLRKTVSAHDKRTENLSLTEKGEEMRRTLGQAALRFDMALGAALGEANVEHLRLLLTELRKRTDRLGQ